MFLSNEDAKVVCTVGGDDSVVFAQVSLNYMNNNVHTLEFSDITKEFSTLWSVNEQLHLYKDKDDLKRDLSRSYLQSFLRNPIKNDRLNLLFKTRLRALHKQGLCGDNCTFCNPDLDDGSFFDFTADIKILDVQGTV